MHNALVALVVLVREQGRPLFRQVVFFHRETVVLCRYETPLRPEVSARLVVAAVSVPKNITKNMKSVGISLHFG